MSKQITVNKNDFQELLINAVRYALPRQSYITAVIAELVEKYMNDVDKRTLCQIRVDILRQKHEYGLDIGWADGLSGPMDIVVSDCFRKRFGLMNADHVSLCSWCNSTTNTDKDNDGNYYCSRCGRLKPQ